MRKIGWFEAVLIVLPIFLTGALLAAIISLFLVPTLAEIWESLLSEEMLFSLKLTVWTSSLSTALVFMVAVPTGYSLSRINFWGKSMVKAIIDLPIAFPELVLGLCLLLLFGNPVLQNFLEDWGLILCLPNRALFLPSSLRHFPMLSES